MSVRHRQVNRPFIYDWKSYTQYINSLKPLLWYKFNETSGTTLINHGSASNANGVFTPANGAIGQSGQFGLNSAYAFDGSDSIVVIPNGAYSDVNNFTVATLVNSINAGESNNGAVWIFGNSSNYRLIHLSSTTLSARRDLSLAVPQLLTNTATITPTHGVWQWLILTYNNTDKKLHLYKGYKGRLTEFTYTTDITGNGNPTDTTTDLNIGNNTSKTFSWNGLIGNFVWIDSQLSSSRLLDIVKFSGV